MKKIFLTVLTLLAVPALNATVVTLASKEVLEANLKKAGFTHITEPTKLVQQLAGKQIEVLNLLTSVECCVLAYGRYVKDPATAAMAVAGELRLVQALLKDNPDAQKEAHDLYRKKYVKQ